jgi:hypothetical protein
LGQKPDKDNLRKQWCISLGIGQEDILAGETIPRIAYWHFPERFRHFDEKVGVRKLKHTDKWVDNERKEWLVAVPIRNLDELFSSYLSLRHGPTLHLPAVVSSTVQKPRQITFSPSSSRRVLSAPTSSVPKSTALIEPESAYKVVNLELAVANKCIFDSQKENSSLK